jgi:DNA-binding NarL/FixJ family response regulator
MHTEDQYGLRTVRAGIKGYVIKTQSAEHLVDAVREISHGMFYLSPGIPQTIVDALVAQTAVRRNPLTRRERQVLQLIVEGRMTKEIVSLLSPTPKTAESHRSHITEKLGIHETAGLVCYATRQGLIQP